MRLIIPIRAYSWPPFFSIQKCLSKRLAVILHEVSKHYGCASAVIGDKHRRDLRLDVPNSGSTMDKYSSFLGVYGLI